jgi:hypothetical protein
MGVTRFGRRAAAVFACGLSLWTFGAVVEDARAQVGGPATITLDPATDVNRAGEQHCVTATVRNATGAPVANVRVRFSRSGANGSFNQQATTNSVGQATFCYTGNRVGVDTFTAYADTDNDATRDPTEPVTGATKTYVAADPASVIVSPGNANNDVGEQHCVTATVSDRFGNRTPGVTVRFTVTGANSAAGAIPTDSNGQARFCYTGTRAGEDTIRAHADTNNNLAEDPGEPVGTARKRYRPGPSVAVTVTPTADTNAVGEQHCVTARAVDAFGNPRTDAVIVFTVTGVNNTGGTVTTNSSGDAVFCYTGRMLGADAIRAFHDKDNDGNLDTGEPVGTAAKTWVPGAPALLVLEPLADENPTGQEHCVTATVTDALGNATPGVIVRFSIVGANPTAGSRTTNSAGQATFCYTGTSVGPDTITAYADTDRDNVRDVGEPTGTAVKAYLPGQPATLVLDPPAAVNDAGQQHCVTGTVRDAFANPIGGVRVVFSVTGANPRGAASRTTDGSGEARFCYTGTRAGLDAIQAFADTNGNGTRDLVGEPSGAAATTYVAAAPATLTLTPKTAANQVGTQHCVTATVADMFGNPNQGVTVRFSVTGAATRSGAATTNSDGNARFCYTGPSLPGADAIRAYADTNRNSVQDAGEPFDAAEKTWVLPASTPGCQLLIESEDHMHVHEGGKIQTVALTSAQFAGHARVDEGVPSPIEGHQSYKDYGIGLNFRSLEILALTCSPDRRESTIYGRGLVNNEDEVLYRISVEDNVTDPDENNGEVTDDTYEIELSGGYTSGPRRPLKYGNIAIR